MDEEHADQVRRHVHGLPPQAGGPRRPLTLREEYGEDIYPLETVMVFRRSGRETRSAVKVADGVWRLTGALWLRRWPGLLRKVGHGYEPSVSD